MGEHGRWIHYGLTSSDVLDTALALQLRQAHGRPALFRLFGPSITPAAAPSNDGQAVDLYTLTNGKGMVAKVRLAATFPGA